MVIADLIHRRAVDCVVSTGANLYHDLHETRGQRHFLGSPRADDRALADAHIDRVYDTFVDEDEFVRNDIWIARFAATLEPRPHTTREFLFRLGERLWTETGADGILTAAYRANVPVFCPAIADSSLGMGLSQARHDAGGAGQVDVIGDIIESANLVNPPAANCFGGSGGWHSQELHQPGERAGCVLSRRHRGTPLRPTGGNGCSALRRRERIDPRRSRELGKAGW